jgi:hypothetical protein
VYYVWILVNMSGLLPIVNILLTIFNIFWTAFLSLLWIISHFCLSSWWEGSGCPKCANKNVTTKEFIEKSKLIHGDKYDYSKVDYKYSNKDVIIICKIHGDFLQIPNTHLNNHGCSKCAGIAKSNTTEFIENAKLIHGDKYEYFKVDYKNNITKVIITCKVHGDFLQTPKSHLKGHGCQ